MTGDPEGQKRLSQTVNISGSKDDTFVLAGWAKGDSAPIDKENVENRTFGIEGDKGTVLPSRSSDD